MIAKKIRNSIKSSRFVQYCAKHFFDYIYQRDQEQEITFSDRQKPFFLDLYLPGLFETIYWERNGFDEGLSFESTYRKRKKHIPLWNHDTMGQLVYAENGVWIDNDGNNKQIRYALSGGTTQIGKSNKKAIYVPYDIDDLNDAAFHSICASFTTHYPDENFFATEFLPLGGSLREETDAFIAGDVSALLMKSKEGVTGHLVYPYSVDELTQPWQDKYNLFLETLHTKNIGAIMGTTKWIAMMLEEISSKYPERREQLKKTLQGILRGGVDIGPYRQIFEKLGIKNTMGIYNAAEGVLGYQDLTIHQGVWYRFLETGFFEFIPRIAIKDGNIYDKHLPCFWIGELTKEIFEVYGNEFLLIYSTPGQIRSPMDVLKLHFFDAKLRFQIIGRVGGFINLVGEELLESQANIAIQQLSEKLCTPLQQRTVAPSENNQYHEWVIESGSNFETHMIAEMLDTALQALNGDYNDKRVCGRLQAPKLHIVTGGTFDRFHASQGKEGGQTKCLFMSGGREYMDNLLTFFQCHIS